MRRIASVTAFLLVAVAWVGIAAAQPPETILQGSEGVEAVFSQAGGGYSWGAYRDTRAGSTWPIAGPVFSVQTGEGQRTNLCPPGFAALRAEGEGGARQMVLQTRLETPPVEVRQVFSFCADGRTLRIRSELRASGDPLTIQRAGLLEIQVPGQTFQRMGPEMVSSPIFGDRVFAGIEHPSAWCQVDGDKMYLAQHSYVPVNSEWVSLPAAVFGSASEADVARYGAEALRRAFLRYLDTVRVKPRDMHVHYNDWWTAPVPSSQEFVLNNIATLKQGLFDTTGFFFDSYALDMGWSDAHSVWQMDHKQFPNGFAPLREALAQAGGHVGLWISPSSLYPPALDNAWLEAEGYEVTPHSTLGRNACLAKGGKYQQAFKAAALKHADEAGLAHMKFDGFVPNCDVAGHGHPTGAESWLPLAEGLMDVFDALRAEHPDIALEPTCFGYYPSPWWLMHTPFIIGPFGDDSPYGRVPCPEYIESMTTARDIENLNGRNAFMMPSAALQCFDIIVQCPGAFQNHAVMAIGRGRWFISNYINPKYMDAGEWRFFADLMRWARANRDFLQEPVPFGGKPEDRQAYGYWFSGAARQLYCLRNPWIEEAELALPALPESGTRWRLQTLYPRRMVLGHVSGGAPFPWVRLGPYETLMVEAVPAVDDAEPVSCAPAPGISWSAFECGKPDKSTVAMAGNLSIEGVSSAECCLLVEGLPEAADSRAALFVNGKEVPLAASASRDGFGAAGAGRKEHWVWFTTAIPAGERQIEMRFSLPNPGLRVAAYLRGTADVNGKRTFEPSDPAFPLYRPEEASWSRVLVPVTAIQ